VHLESWKFLRLGRNYKWRVYGNHQFFYVWKAIYHSRGFIGRWNFSRRGQDMKKYVHNFFNLLDIYIQEQLVAHEKLSAELN
jgi:hypothetical protein